MQKRTRTRAILAVLALSFLVLILADAMGAFNSLPYDEVPHGDHVHYVPRDRDPNTSVSAFPTAPPAEGMRISPTGQVVPAN